MSNKIQVYLEEHQKTLGYIGTPLAIIMFVSLIEVLISNLKGESKIVIQPLFTALNGFIWVLYGYGRKDYFLLIPNAVAFVLGVITTAVIFI
ncbi:SemiSWEET family transporter [Wenyingzhuangia sp. IMCC45574]